MSKFDVILFAVVAVALIFGGIWWNRDLDERAAAGRKAEEERILGERKKILEKLVREDIVVGTGDEARNGDTVQVHYVGTFEDGRKFDSSVDRGQPYEFRLGAGEVIDGWDLGVPGMKVGGKRNLVIPPELAYGSSGFGPIPPDATLKFSVELLGVKREGI
ncbi:FKBP-type peptidyl-prolyl cis-trans isomerase [Candidatus Parcubacteria bacterium]|nr:MAG: FKBP-type peptidyl-prolyl cis-trans isomerase [Candidatus Parcubacteria bacterium]